MEKTGGFFAKYAQNAGRTPLKKTSAYQEVTLSYLEEAKGPHNVVQKGITLSGSTSEAEDKVNKLKSIKTPE